jgi:hypothetical protein
MAQEDGGRRLTRAGSILILGFKLAILTLINSSDFSSPARFLQDRQQTAAKPLFVWNA